MADPALASGHEGGLASPLKQLVRTGRGFPEGLIEAWGNLYTEFALAIAATRDGADALAGWLAMPRVEEGADGVRFIEAAVRSHEAGGSWQAI